MTTWSKLGMTFTGVSVDTLLDGRASAADGDPRARVLPHRLHDEPAARRRDRRAGRGSSWEVDGEPLPGRARRPRPVVCAASLLLEERRSGSPGSGCSITTSPGSGSRTATTTAATPGSSSATKATDRWLRPPAPPMRWQSATVVGDHSRDRPREDVSPGVRRAPRRIGPASTTSCASPRPTATPRQRSYSVASRARRGREIELTVERLEGGEVSTFLHDDVVVGDELEVRGPIGGWFVWDGDAPALLVGGGSGVVPLMAMLRLARRRGESDLVRLVVSVRTPRRSVLRPRAPRPRVERRVHPRRAPGVSRAARPAHCDDIRGPDASDARRTSAAVGFCDAATDLAVGSRPPGRAYPRRALRSDGSAAQYSFSGRRTSSSSTGGRTIVGLLAAGSSASPTSRLVRAPMRGGDGCS